MNIMVFDALLGTSSSVSCLYKADVLVFKLLVENSSYKNPTLRAKKLNNHMSTYPLKCK